VCALQALVVCARISAVCKMTVRSLCVQFSSVANPSVCRPAAATTYNSNHYKRLLGAKERPYWSMTCVLPDKKLPEKRQRYVTKNCVPCNHSRNGTCTFDIAIWPPMTLSWPHTKVSALSTAEIAPVCCRMLMRSQCGGSMPQTIRKAAPVSLLL